MYPERRSCRRLATQELFESRPIHGPHLPNLGQRSGLE